MSGIRTQKKYAGNPDKATTAVMNMSGVHYCSNEHIEKNKRPVMCREMIVMGVINL
jgi:hypothetical protein